MKRLRITRNGKILGRKPGGNHYNAKQSRSRQLIGKRSQSVFIKNKDKARFLPGII